MNEVIKVDFEKQTVSARELHEALGVASRFNRWFDNNKELFVEGEDYNKCTSSTVVGNGAVRELDDYEITIIMAKHLALMSRTEKGKIVRQYLIDLEKAWNTPEQIMARALKMADNTIMSLKEQNRTLIEDNERMKPKEIFADAVSASDTSILVRDLAKMLRQNGVSVGEKRLYKWMRQNGYICMGSTTPTQKAMELGLFETIVRTVNRGDKNPIETMTTKVTGKGQQYFVNKFLNK